jgi:NTP pyrophosphatase (non-canonical NTP hydrolase)
MNNSERDSINDLKLLLRGFADNRDWNQFHTPRNLVLALAGEVGELAATLQWVSDCEVSEWLKSPENRSQFEAELADVLSYLLRLADQTDVDLGKALRAKLLVNELRYPEDRSHGSSGKYTDYE